MPHPDGPSSGDDAATPLLRSAASVPLPGRGATRPSEPSAVHWPCMPTSPLSRAALEAVQRRRCNELDGERHRVPSVQDMEMLRGPRAEWRHRIAQSLRRKCVSGHLLVLMLSPCL